MTTKEYRRMWYRFENKSPLLVRRWKRTDYVLKRRVNRGQHSLPWSLLCLWLEIPAHAKNVHEDEENLKGSTDEYKCRKPAKIVRRQHDSLPILQSLWHRPSES